MFTIILRLISNSREFQKILRGKETDRKSEIYKAKPHEGTHASVPSPFGFLRS